MQVVVGVNVQLTLLPGRAFLGFDIVAPAPPDKAIIGRYFPLCQYHYG